MSILTQAFYDQMSDDPILAALLSAYGSAPAIFTTDPIPDDFSGETYIVTVGEVSQIPDDSKNCRGRDILRDVRAYDAARGSAERIEAVSERVRALFHRQALTIAGYTWVLSNVTGPIVADEPDHYGRILTVEVIAAENELTGS